MPQSLATNHTMVLVDIASFTDPARTRAHQTIVRKALYAILEQAFAEAGVDWSDCYHEDRGDGVMILVPAVVPPIILANQLLDRLVAGLRDHNAVNLHETSIRLRVALHAGLVEHDSSGAAGPDLNYAFRLVEASVAKQLLHESTGVLAVVASERFYEEVIFPQPSAAPDHYRRIHVETTTLSADAWFRLLGQNDGPPIVLGGFSDEELDRIRAWLAEVEEADFNAIARRVASAALPFPRFDAPWHAFLRLEDVNAGADGVPPGLVFLAALADEKGGDLGATIREWAEEKARRLGVEEAFHERCRALSAAPDDARLHLLFAVDRDAINCDRYMLSVWRQDTPGVWPPTRIDIRDVEFADLEGAVDKAVVDAERAWSDQGLAVTLEALLPRELLHLPVHRWSKEHEFGHPRPLCLDYIIHIRSLERMKSTYWHRLWRERWQSMKADPSPTRIHYATNNTERVDVALGGHDSVAIVLASAPSPQCPKAPAPDEYTEALSSGLPVLLWHPNAPTTVLRPFVETLVGRGGLIELPERTRKSRRDTLEGDSMHSGDNLARDLVVLWDDPDRKVEVD